MVFIINLIKNMQKGSNRKKGFTLLELIITISIFSIVIAAAGSAIHSATSSYALTAKMLDDEYNARLALLSITREAHRGITEAEYNEEDFVLTMKTVSKEDIVEFEVEYELESDGILRRRIITGDTHLAFAEVELQSFIVNVDGRWVNIKISGKNGLELETTISLLRIPTA